MYVLEKYSSPGWEKSFETQEELINHLRSHICKTCLSGYHIYLGEDGEEIEEDNWSSFPVDVEYDGVFYPCRDIQTLLSTACGCEYGVQIDGKYHWEWEHP